MIRFLRWLFRRHKITESNPYQLPPLMPGECRVSIIRRGEDGSVDKVAVGTWMRLGPGESLSVSPSISINGQPTTVIESFILTEQQK